MYVTQEEIRRRLAATSGDLAPLGSLCARAILAAARCQGIIFAGAYPELAFRGEVPRLLADGTAALGTPAIAARSSEWESVGLGAIQDLVQDAFGPVDFDRSMVALPSSDEPLAGCPACAAERWGFPGDLMEAKPRMCKPHHALADDVTARRIARARASNPQGWRAIAKGSARISGIRNSGPGPIRQLRRSVPGRKDPCPCGSGRKYKHCCGT